MKSKQINLRKPNFFIAGAPKCGTTSMYAVLSQHPEIYMSPVKEPGYFATDILSPRIFIQNPKHYASLFKKVKNEKVVGEASVMYFNSDVAPKKIKEECGNTKILIMLRNPIDMMFSLYKDRKARYVEHSKDFREALALEKVRERSKIKMNPQNHFKAECAYRFSADYYPKVKRYQDIFGKENVMVVILEEYIKEPSKVFEEIASFLKVNREFIPDFRVLNQNPGFIQTKQVMRLYNAVQFLPHPVKDVLRRLKNFKYYDTFPHVLNGWIFRLFSRWESSMQEKLEPNLRKTLMKDFKPRIRRLEGILGRRLGIWLK